MNSASPTTEAKQGGHTPGPWRLKTTGNMGNCVEGLSGRPVDEYDDGFRVVAMFQACTASTQYAEEDANAAANGRLIAAAPELLEALEVAAERECSSWCAESVGEHTKACKRNRAAIAKARGDA